MWIFIQRVDGQYAGEAYLDDGTTVLAPTAPMPERELQRLIEPLNPYGDWLDYDTAIYEADQRDEAMNEPCRDFFLLRVRASAGTASREDGQWVVDQLRKPDGRFASGRLLYTLSLLGAEYEEVAARILDKPNIGGQCEDAMSALVRMGLGDKYAPVLVQWMTGDPPLPPTRIGSRAYGIASHVLRQTGNIEILRAFVAAGNDRSERWTSREHALSCLAGAIDLENLAVWLGTNMPPDHPYMQSVLAKAERMLAEHENAL